MFRHPMKKNKLNSYAYQCSIGVGQATTTLQIFFFFHLRGYPIFLLTKKNHFLITCKHTKLTLTRYSIRKCIKLWKTIRNQRETFCFHIRKCTITVKQHNQIIYLQQQSPLLVMLTLVTTLSTPRSTYHHALSTFWVWVQVAPPHIGFLLPSTALLGLPPHPSFTW